MRYVIWRDAEVAELADAHGSGPCDSNIMRVQVPSSARRLKSKDLSLFLVSHQQSRDAAAPKGPRVSSGFRQSHLSLHTLPFLPSSRQYTAPTGIRARTSLGGGSWFPLGSQENTLEVRGHLFEQRKLRVVSSDLRP